MAERLLCRWKGGSASVELVGDRHTVGRSEQNDVVLPDRSVSSLHAVIEDHGAGWTVRDLASTNGTWVGGQRIWGERRLQAGDDIRFGNVRARLDQERRDITTTERIAPLPPLTTREGEVLVELCRPLATGSAFTPPATVREIADRLYISPGAVKQHLQRLYKKFDVAPDGERRVTLANEAFHRGAVAMDDLLG